MFVLRSYFDVVFNARLLAFGACADRNTILQPNAKHGIIAQWKIRRRNSCQANAIVQEIVNCSQIQ